MANGFDVNPSALSSASVKLKTLAAGADVSGPVSLSGQTAGAVNSGYMTSQAIKNFLQCFEEAGDAMKGRLDDHSAALGECVQTYEATDQEAANPFNSHLSDL
jgi:hypothetical protein